MNKANTLARAVAAAFIVMSAAACNGGGGGDSAGGTSTVTTPTTGTGTGGTTGTGTGINTGTTTSGGTTGGTTSGTTTGGTTGGMTGGTTTGTGTSTGTGAGGSTGGTTTTPTVPASDLTADCSGTGCGATSNNSYKPGSTGVYTKTNTTAAAKAFTVNVGGLTNNKVSIVLANSTGATVSLTGGAGAGVTTSANIVQASTFGGGKQLDLNNRIPDFVERFNRDVASHVPSARKLAQSYVGASAYVENNLPISASYAVNDRRTFKTTDTGDYSPIATTLKGRAALSNGGFAHVWIQDTALTSITQARIDALLSKFAAPSTGIFDLVTGLVGQPWGMDVAQSVNGNMVISGAEKDIHILVKNLNPDGQPYGTIGYFWGAHNYKSVVIPYSNEALMFLVDSETLAADTQAFNVVLSTLGHEMQHMVQMYQKNILRNVQPSTWLNELASLGVEEILDNQILDSQNYNLFTYSGGRFSTWLSNPNCQLTYWYSSTPAANGCDLYSSYSTAGSFAMYLSRYYGPMFWKDVGQSSGIDMAAIDSAIKKQNVQDSAAEAYRRWSASAQVATTGSTPAAYSYPARSDGKYNLQAITPNTTHKSYTTLPATLAPDSFVIWNRGNKTGTYSETITLPAGVSATVVIQ